MRFMIVASVVALSTSAIAQASDTALKQTLLKLEEDRQAAYVRGDRATLERQLATEYNHTNLRGGTTNRQDEIAFYAPGTFSLARGTIDDVSVRDYGRTAVLLGTVTWEGATYRPNPKTSIDLSGHYRITRVYVKRDGRWQVAASHASLIPPAQPPAGN